VARSGATSAGAFCLLCGATRRLMPGRSLGFTRVRPTASPPSGDAVWGADIADCDRRRIPAGFVGCCRQVAEHCVGESIGFNSEFCGVVWGEAFDEVLGRQCSTSGRTGLNARGVVDVVTERRDFGSASGGDGRRLRSSLRRRASSRHSGRPQTHRREPIRPHSAVFQRSRPQAPDAARA
jgi:hypothetical protein